MNRTFVIAFQLGIIIFTVSMFIKILILISQSTIFFGFYFAIFSLIITVLLNVFVFKYLTKGTIKSIGKTFQIFFISGTITSILAVPLDIFIHNYADVYYKERIADYKLEVETKKIREIEQKKNVKMNFDPQKDRAEFVSQYSTENILKMPMTFLPFNLFISLILSAILTKFGTLEDKKEK